MLRELESCQAATDDTKQHTARDAQNDGRSQSGQSVSVVEIHSAPNVAQRQRAGFALSRYASKVHIKTCGVVDLLSILGADAGKYDH